jgi:hypothetical protein
MSDDGHSVSFPSGKVPHRLPLDFRFGSFSACRRASFGFNNWLSNRMSIRPLPPDVVAQIKSSTTITSLNGVVSELVQNSLDAGSTKIDISVDYSRGGCIVEDDGLGILPSEFGKTGSLGKPYRRDLGIFCECLVAALTRDRFLQVQQSNPYSRRTRDVPCLCISYVSIVHHISSPFASVAQHNKHAQVGNYFSTDSSSRSASSGILRSRDSCYC